MAPYADAHHRLKTPRAAALAGILFSVLLLIALDLLMESVQTGLDDPGVWLASDARKVGVAVNLMPFAGVAFLWFVSVMRDRDRLFATVFLGSGLLFIGTLFVAASIVGAMLITNATAPSIFPGSPEFRLARSFAYYLTSAFSLKMAGVFIVTASTLVLRTGFTARWTAIIGYLLAGIMFPVWVFIISANILIEEFRRPADGREARATSGS